MTDYAYHPLCLAFPEMTPDAYAKRLADYRKHPKRADDTAVLLAQDEGEWKILDGRHHYRICQELGYECRFEKVEGDRDELADIAEARGINRRHQTESQIGAAIVALNDFRHGGDHSNKDQNAPGRFGPGTNDKPAGSRKGKTQSAAAKSSGVSTRTLSRVSAAAKAEPALLTAMRDGKIDAKTAEKVAKLPAAERKKVVSAKDPKKAAKKALAKSPKKAPVPPASSGTDPDDPPADPRFMPNAEGAAALAEQFRNWVARLRSVRTEMTKALSDREHVLHKRIDFGNFDASLGELVETLDKNVPAHVCPPCCGTGTDEGRTCKYCDGYGVVDAHHHDGLKARWKHTRARFAQLSAGKESA